MNTNWLILLFVLGIINLAGCAWNKNIHGVLGWLSSTVWLMALIMEKGGFK